MTKEDFSIKLDAEIKVRKIKVDKFVLDYGRGDVGLTIKQISKRVDKILGVEKEKVKGFGSNKNIGVELYKEHKKQKIVEEGKCGFNKRLPDEVMDKIKDYPKDIRCSEDRAESRIFDIVIKEDGGCEIYGIILNGNEKIPELCQTYSVSIPSDRELSLMESKQYEKGELKEVSDRTMKIHEEKGLLDNLFKDPVIDTEEDKEIQY